MGHSLLPEVFQNYWPSCAQKNFRILDESLKKNLKKNLEKTPLELCSLFWLVLSVTWLWTVRWEEEIGVPHLFQESPGRKEEAAHLQLSPRHRRGHRGARAGISSPTALPLPEGFKSAFPRTTRAQCNRNSLLEAWDTRVSLGGDSSLSTSEGPVGPNHISMEHGQWGQAAPLHKQIPTCPKHLWEPLHLFSWWQHKEDTATHNFHPSTLLLASSSPCSE